MDVDGDLGSQFVGQVLKHLPLIHCFLIGPQEVKPLDDSLLQVLRYLRGQRKVEEGLKIRILGVNMFYLFTSLKIHLTFLTGRLNIYHLKKKTMY